MSGAEKPAETSRPILGTVLQCQPHAPFLPSLAAAIRDGAIWRKGTPEPHELAQLVVYLPTRATVEAFRLAFLASAPERATFLPRVRVLGQPDPLDLFATHGTRMASAAEATALFEEMLAVPGEFGELEREIELTALIMQAPESLTAGIGGIDTPFLHITPASALKMARQIAGLIGEAHAEDASLFRVPMLGGASGTGSGQLSLQLLRAVISGWLARKKKAGLLDPEERRNRLMAIEAEFIKQSETPVIIAGSTGSIAATARLMEAALGRPHSALVFYGLDSVRDDIWNTLGAHPDHSQHGLHDLLTRFNLRPADVRSLPTQDGPPASSALKRASFLGCALWPAPATAGWGASAEEFKRDDMASFSGLSLIEAETLQDEALVIALILRECLEKEGQTAALVTPNDALHSRVSHVLAKWGFSPIAANVRYGDLAALALSCAASGKPSDFIALMRSCGARTANSIGRAVEIAELGVLRQMWRPRSFSEMPAAISRAEHAISSGEARHPALKRIAAAEWDAARTLIAGLIEALHPLSGLSGKMVPLAAWSDAHRDVLVNFGKLGLAAMVQENSVLAPMQTDAPKSLMLGLADYAQFYAEAASEQRRAPHDNPHPRLRLLKPLDARLISADVLILAGLNEGCWPQAPGPDPWLTRRDRAFLGLPPQERRIGQAAHDFATLALSAPMVYLTRAKKIDGTASRPSRWISRIKALESGIGSAKLLQPEAPWLAWASLLGAPQKIEPASRPEPRPPLAARPRRLSVTAIETWFANPYGLYARHILGLDPLRGWHETGDARDKGILYHAALNSFFQAYPAKMPQNAAAKLLERLDRAAEELGFNLENAPFWRPRFARFAQWFESTETARRGSVELLKSEVGGKLRLETAGGSFEITARADRIDRLADGSLRIYDFKTSANTAKVAANRGAPQLALEGLLAKEGAFAGILASATVELKYIVASGGEPPGEIVELKMVPAEAIEAAHRGTLQRIALFDDEATPYAYETRAIYRDKAESDPYAHLARLSEWNGAESADADDN